MRVKFPNEPDAMADFYESCQRYILPGYSPERPFLRPGSKIVAVGSCFAAHVADALQRQGMTCAHLELTEASNTAIAAAMMVDLALAQPGPARDALLGAELFVLTLGVGFGPYLNGEPVKQINRENKDQVVWRFLEPKEIAQNLLTLISGLRSMNPGIAIVVTLSPLPLNSSLIHRSVMGADRLSKSTLRVGIEAVISMKIDKVFYWPSFEMVRWLAPHRERVFGVEDADNRHIPTTLVDRITGLFAEKYVRSTETQDASG